jgi:cell division protein FtsQ
MTKPGLPAGCQTDEHDGASVLASRLRCWCWCTWCVGFRACPCLRLRGIAVTGDVTHYNAITCVPMWPRLQGTFFTLDLRSARRYLNRCPGCVRPWCAASFPTICGCCLQEHQAVAFGVRRRIRLVNNFGEVFEANVGEVEQDDLPRFPALTVSAGRCWPCTRRCSPCFAAMDMVSGAAGTDRAWWLASAI